MLRDPQSKPEDCWVLHSLLVLAGQAKALASEKPADANCTVEAKATMVERVDLILSYMFSSSE
jgi:hypothetical protein